MPQLNIVTYVTQSVWLCATFLVTYLMLSYFFIPQLAYILKARGYFVLERNYINKVYEREIENNFNVNFTYFAICNYFKDLYEDLTNLLSKESRVHNDALIEAYKASLEIRYQLEAENFKPSNTKSTTDIKKPRKTSKR